MATDEAFLDLVAEDASSALLRTYGWTEPTLTLGYFQKYSEAEADPRWRDVPIVRRPTGGGAIWHHYELTYAIVIPTTYHLARSSTALYHGVHEALAVLLRSYGLAVERRGPVSHSEIAGRPFLCFTDRDSEDIVSHGVKIVGSAQRRRKGAILQHGSLILKCSPTIPELLGARDLGMIPSEPRYWSELFELHLPRTLGFIPVSHDFPVAIRQRAAELERKVYRNPSWTRKR